MVSARSCARLIWALVVVHAVCGLTFPAELESTVLAKDVCDAPSDMAVTDLFEFKQYQRIPFTTAAHLENFKTNPEAFGKHSDLLHRIYKHPLFLNSRQIQQSISSTGDEARMQRFVTKLVTGQPVKVIVLGGSISAGHGVGNPELNSWSARLFKWISETFPHAQHVLVNKAIPATTSGFTSPCAHTVVPGDTDLVLVEFTINDSYDDFTYKMGQWKAGHTCGNGIDTPGRRAMERLMRAMLDLPNRPAVLWMHMWNLNIPFYGGVEDVYSSIFNYYGVTALSERNAMHQMVREQDILHDKMYNGRGNFHPNCVGTRFVSDMLIGYLMDEASTAAWLVHTNTKPQLRIQIHAGGKPGQPVASSLPEPLFKGNYASKSTHCVFDEAVKNYVPVNNGWTWTNEGTPADPKWGFVSRQVGTQLIVKVPVENVTTTGSDMAIGMGMLISYSKEMGVVLLTCISGCLCAPQEKSTLLPYANYSMVYWEPLPVKVLPGSNECSILVTNMAKTFSEGHKLKLAALLISSDLDIKSITPAFFEQGIARAKEGYREG